MKINFKKVDSYNKNILYVIDVVIKRFVYMQFINWYFG